MLIRQRAAQASGGTTLLAAVLLLAGGCGGGPERHPVRGTVTLDGAPLPEARVTFVAEKEGGPWGAARTDAQGKYTIRAGENQGLPVGNYKVRVSTYQDGNPQPDPPIPSVPERVPMEYNRRTTLTREVKPGENVFPLELESGGEIFQPPAR
jgi:hypothetical protein